MFLWLLAQSPGGVPPSDISGIIGLGGWAGAGLLGGVLLWLLFFHLPSKDKQLKEFIEAKDKHVESMVANCESEIQSLAKQFSEQLKESRSDFKEALSTVMRQSTEQSTMVASIIKKELESLTSVIATQSSLLSMIQRDITSSVRRPPGT